MPSCCTTQQFVPYMHIHKRTDWFFPTYKKHDFLQVCSTKQVTPPNGQTIGYKLKSIRASMKHVVVCKKINEICHVFTELL